MAKIFNDIVASLAITYSLPLIESLMELEVTKRNHLHIVVGNSEGSILATKSIGNPEDWEHRYDEIAESKFNITVRTSQLTRIVQQVTPELAGEVGDTFYWGSWIDGGIVVACSGVQPYWDEAFSKVISAMVRALVTDEQVKEISNGGDFRQ